MAQDTALLRYLLKWARRAPWSWSQRDLAFEFDWTNDYISSNATIGRTGYDMNVSWNVSTGSDGDGSYIQINWNRASWVWTVAQCAISSWVVFNQWTSFSIGGKFKVNSYAPTAVSWLFGSNFDVWVHHTTTNTLVFWLRGSTTVQNTYTTAFTLGTSFYIHLTYDATTARFYCYINGALQNAWGTAWPATFSTLDWILWDTAITWWVQESSNKYAYHAAIRNKALTQVEVDADIALWNTAKNDPTIVAYYIPDNLTYNTQYMTNPKALDQSPWSLSGASTVTADTTVAPDGTTTADTVAISWTATQWIEQPNTTITWAAIASKTFIVKAFVKVTAGTALFRLKMSHRAVADYFSANQTATTTRQEFTFTQTFTSSTSGTGIIGWVSNDTWATNPTLLVRNVRVFLTNETLRDESPNIWWFIWWKTPLVMSARVKPWIDASDTTSSQVIIKAPRHYLHLRTSTNILYFRSETTLESRVAPLWWTAILWTWNRNKVHILWVKYRDWTGRRYKSYVNWVLTSWSQTAYSTTLRPASTIYTTQLLVWKDNTATYYTWNERDIRAYTFTWSFTDADALAIYNGGEPASSGITKYLHYRPPVGEVGTTTQDQSPNDRDWTLNGWVTRDYI